MPVKMTGAQYKAFLRSNWGPDAYWEDSEVIRNGEPVDCDVDSDPATFEDGDAVEIVAGTIIPDQRVELAHQEQVDAVKFARKWLKSQTHVTLMVEVDRQDVDFWKGMINSSHSGGRKAKVKVVG